MAAIKNEHSTVPAEKSINEIEKALVGIGARKISKEYDSEGRLSALSFQAPVNGGATANFLLPARVDACFRVLMDQYTRPTSKSRENARNQAERTAWRIIADWVKAQAAIIQLDQAEFAQVFLPFVYNPETGQTLYEIAKARGFQNLIES